MKTQLSKPARSKARYTEEYKKEALELWRASGRSAAKVAAELGIRPPLLYRWAQLERDSKSSRSELKPGRSVAELEAEIRRLRAENAKLLEQREVLKKSLGILSEVPPGGIREEFMRSRKTYGSPRLARVLGCPGRRNRIARLMRLGAPLRPPTFQEEGQEGVRAKY